MFVIPEEQSDAIRAHAAGVPRGFKSVQVQVYIRDSSSAPEQTIAWRTSVFPMRRGGYFLPVKADVRRRAGITAGDEVTVELELL